MLKRFVLGAPILLLPASSDRSKLPPSTPRRRAGTRIRALLSWVAVVSVVSTALPADAQTGDGSLRGYVKDEQGGVLPGVTVTATGPALLAPVVAVTDNAGFYRLQNLPPGTLTVSAELSGFATFRREGIHIRAGSTFTVDIELNV